MKRLVRLAAGLGAAGALAGLVLVQGERRPSVPTAAGTQDAARAAADEALAAPRDEPPSAARLDARSALASGALESLSLAAAPREDASPRIRGRVLARAGGRPLAGVEVEASVVLDGDEGSTMAFGESGEEGTYSLVCAELVRTVQARGARLEWIGAFPADGAAPTGRLHRSERLEPGETVAIGPLAGPAAPLLVTGRECEDRFLVGVAHDGPRPVEVRLTRLLHARLAGRVLEASGAPVPQAQITALVPRARSAATTGADGTFELRDLPAGDAAVLCVLADGHAVQVEHPVRLADGAPPLVMRLDPGLRLAGRVVDAGGAPVPGARLVVAGERRLPAGSVSWIEGEASWEEVAGIERTSADREGRFAFDRLHAGELVLRVAPPEAPLLFVERAARAGDEELVVRLDDEPVSTRRIQGPRPLVVAAGLVLWALAADTITVADSDYRAEVLHAIAGSLVALVLLAASWRRMGTASRAGAVVVSLAAGLVLLDAASRRLPVLLGP